MLETDFSLRDRRVLEAALTAAQSRDDFRLVCDHVACQRDQHILDMLDEALRRYLTKSEGAGEPAAQFESRYWALYLQRVARRER